MVRVMRADGPDWVGLRLSAGGAPGPTILPDGRERIIDFQPARGESAAEWKRLPASIHRRCPTGQGLEMIGADSSKGLPAALPSVHPDIPVRRCRAHKIRNAPNPTAARTASPTGGEPLIRKPSNARAMTQPTSPHASDTSRPMSESRCAIERRFQELRRRTRLMGPFRNCTSMEYIFFATFPYRNKNDRTAAPFTVTHKS